MSGRIVVGVDGSEHARRALQYALEEARRRGLDLEVVHAYQLPMYWAQMEFGGPMPSPDRDQAEREAMAVIDRLLPRPPEDVHIERTSVYGPPAASLLQLAQGADLLVVGTRGLGGFKGCYWDPPATRSSPTHRAQSSWCRPHPRQRVPRTRPDRHRPAASRSSEEPRDGHTNGGRWRGRMRHGGRPDSRALVLGGIVVCPTVPPDPTGTTPRLVD